MPETSHIIVMRILSYLPLSSIILALIIPILQAKETSPTTATATTENLLQTSPRKLSDQLKASLAKVRPSCVAIFSTGYGSGVIISPDGLVLTAAHSKTKRSSVSTAHPTPPPFAMP